jgi:hypothetical protein
MTDAASKEALLRALLPKCQAAEIEVVGLRVHRDGLARGSGLLSADAELQLLADGAVDLVLHREDVLEVTVVRLGPEVETGQRTVLSVGRFGHVASHEVAVPSKSIEFDRTSRIS